MTALGNRQPLVLLLILVCFNLLLLSLQVRSQDGRILLRSWGLAVFTPPATFVASVSAGVRGAVDRYFLLRGVESRNRSLRQENQRLKQELYRLQGLERLVEIESRFEKLKSLFSFETVQAGVLWRTFPVYSDRILINAGERDGVSKDAAVFTESGIVGRVLVTTAWSSEVELITDVSAAAGAMVSRSGLQGIVQGSGTGILSLDFIPASESVEVGDLIVTSGTDRVYPKNLPIGTVDSIERGGVYQKIAVNPMVDFSRLEEVAVVVAEH